MAMKELSKLLRYPELEPHNKMQFSFRVCAPVLFGRVGSDPSTVDTASVSYALITQQIKIQVFKANKMLELIRRSSE